ncbi:MAG TPA: hypothetical protein VFI09_04145 [Solirubrobacterales bacterium]|nr:hypothetical protein [Solirubrobacterales bacterium]
MKHLLALAIAVTLACALAPGASAAEFDKYAIESASSSLSSNQAGAHADFTTTFQLSSAEGNPFALTRNVVVKLPAGLFGNPRPFPTCTNLQLGILPAENECPIDSQVGSTKITLGGVWPGTFEDPIYNMADPPPGVAARFGFFAAVYPMAIDVRLDPVDHRLVATIANAPSLAAFIGATTTFWGVPAAESHDIERITPLETITGGGPSGGRPSTLPEVPFMTNPTSCESGQQVEFTATSYQLPESPRTKVVPFPQITGCSLVGFNPEVSVSPSTEQASSGSGLNYTLELPDKGLQFPNVRYDSELQKAVVTLPRGMTLNPSEAEGLGVCSEAELARERYDSAPGEGCAESSKIGNLTSASPVLSEEATGSLYVAKPYENPTGSLVAIYLVLKIPDRGVIVKLAGKVEPDPNTGQLITTFEDVPQLPVSSFDLHFREGARSPLITPPACGTYETLSRLTPHASPASPLSLQSPMGIASGPNHSACPAGGARPFEPGFEAGTLNNQAGSYSPFDMRLTRGDGEQDMGKFSFVLPPGVVPKLAGIPYCPDAAIAQARGRQGPKGGTEEIDGPSCPAASQIGITLGGAGVGSQLTYVPGKLYLAGPWHGDPISAVAIVPAVAGPFDAGTIVVREALRLNPVTHVGEVDGSASDPIPHILKGIPLNVREVRVSADRPEFTLNPTSCETFAAQATIWGDGTAQEPLAPHPVDRSTRFQAAGCAALAFKPRLALKLRGGTRRAKFPALHAVYSPHRGEANLSRLALTFPKSEFIEQGHFRTICTRVQFAAGAGFGSQCPKGSVYGHIKVWTPLLDEPLQGPVYLRSSNHNLPDAVFALHGLVDIEIATRIDSVHGRLRAVVSGAPDAPVSRAIVDMQGGQKGLFVNSRNLCHKQKRNKALVDAGAQNGKRQLSRPVLRALACGKHRVKRHGRHHRRHGR